MERTESLSRRLLQDLGFNTTIEAYIIFINPDFFLYNASRDPTIIFPTQLNRLMDKLNKKPSKITDRHLRFAEKLVSIHIKQSPYTRRPKYCYEQLEKGIICVKCLSFMNFLSDEKIVCNKCGCIEDITIAVLQSIDEFKLLFPDRKITTNAIHEWCKVIKSKKTIRRILMRHFKLIGHAKTSHYIQEPLNND